MLKFTKEYLENNLKTKTIAEIAKENGVCSDTVSKYVKLTKSKKVGRAERNVNKIINKKFGRLKILGYSDSVKTKGSTHVLVKVECECGSCYDARLDSLLEGTTKSCGCYKRDKETQYFHGDITKTFFSTLQYGAKTRNIDFNITVEEIWELYLKQNKKCAISGVDLYFHSKRNKCTVSVDRIDLNIGYTKDNIQIVHKRINIMKGNMSQEEFLYWLYQSYKNMSPKQIDEVSHTKFNSPNHDKCFFR